MWTYLICGASGARPRLVPHLVPRNSTYSFNPRWVDAAEPSLAAIPSEMGAHLFEHADGRGPAATLWLHQDSGGIIFASAACAVEKITGVINPCEPDADLLLLIVGCPYSRVDTPAFRSGSLLCGFPITRRSRHLKDLIFGRAGTRHHGKLSVKSATGIEQVDRHLSRLRSHLGADFPLNKIRERLKCQICSSRNVTITFLGPHQKGGNLRSLFDKEPR